MTRRAGTSPIAVAVVLTVALVMLALPSGSALAAPPLQGWRPDVAAARQYASGRAGWVSFAMRSGDGRSWHYRSATTVPSASVLKVMFMVAYLRSGAVRDRALRESDRDLLEPMIRRSANTPATRIADLLGPRAMNRLARHAGMRDFAYTRPWGATRTSARDQSRFLLRLRRHVPQRHERYAVHLLTRIVPSQRWGIGEVATPGWTQHFKGGWGSGTGAVDHQVVRLVRRDGTRLGLTVTTTGSPSHSYAARTLQGVFRRLLRGLP